MRQLKRLSILPIQNRLRFRASNQLTIDQLAVCFPGIDSKLESPNADGGEVVFIGGDSTTVTVKSNDDLSSWSAGAGDFDIETPKTLRGFILSRSKK